MTNKVRYEKPSLKKFGSVRNLTGGSAGPFMDMGMTEQLFMGGNMT